MNHEQLPFFLVEIPALERVITGWWLRGGSQELISVLEVEPVNGTWIMLGMDALKDGIWDEMLERGREDEQNFLHV